MDRRAVIFGCAGPDLLDEERDFFEKVRPWGFILFGRNITDPAQVRRLVGALRACVADASAPVLIDQEGGRVRRLGPPHWPDYPPAAAYRRIGQGFGLSGVDAARLGGRLIAHDLAALGVNVDCAPVLDVADPEGHEIIGDRAFGETAAAVAQYGRAFAEGLLAGGVLPVIKHVPGHGRATSDSHLELPVVRSGLAELEAVDFAPFRALADLPIAMTAHVVYAAVDPAAPATTSPGVIDRIIRGSIGFDGLLMSDDLSMRALTGSFDDRTRASLAAGCDIVLHCNGDPAEMLQIAEASPWLEGEGERRALEAMARAAATIEPLDPSEGHKRLVVALTGR